MIQSLPSGSRQYVSNHLTTDSGLKGRDAVNLRSVKDRECSQHRDSPRLGATVRRFVFDFDRLVEIDGRRLLALAHLPSSRRRLPVAAPARIAARKGKGRHAEHEEIDAAIAMTGRDVDRHVTSTAGVRVPRSAPRRDSRLERADNLVGEFLVVVASLCGMAAEVSHLLLLGTELFLKTASPPSHGGRRGKGAPAGRERLAKRLDRPNPCGGGRLCEIGLFQSCFMGSASTSFFIWVNKRSALRATWKARKRRLP